MRRFAFWFINKMSDCNKAEGFTWWALLQILGWKTARSNQIMTHGLSAATQTKLDYPLLIVKINAEL